MPTTSVTTSISDEPAFAGYNFTLTCTVTKTEGLSGTPSVSWVDADSQPIVESDNLYLSEQVTSGLTTTKSLYFDPLRLSDEGSYMCVASLSSSALSAPLSSTVTDFVDVQESKKKYVVLMCNTLYALNRGDIIPWGVS